MYFSKSFGYALRGILYIALTGAANQKVQVDEISGALGVPKAFLGKILKKMAHHQILDSTRGPNGGFFINSRTLSTSLYDLIVLIDGDTQFTSCVLRLKKCNSKNPCPLHDKMQAQRNALNQLFKTTTIENLLDPN